jgi:hypothetical protein
VSNHEISTISTYSPTHPSLPKLRDEVRKDKATTESQLSALPPRLAQTPSLELLKLITAYTDKLGSIARGGKGDGELLRLCKPAFTNFRAAIRHTAPYFVPRLAQQSRISTPNAADTNSTQNSPEPHKSLANLRPKMSAHPALAKQYLPSLRALEANSASLPESYAIQPHDPGRNGGVYAKGHPARDPDNVRDVSCEYSEDSDDGGDHEPRSKRR